MIVIFMMIVVHDRMFINYSFFFDKNFFLIIVVFIDKDLCVDLFLL